MNIAVGTREKLWHQNPTWKRIQRSSAHTPGAEWWARGSLFVCSDRIFTTPNSLPGCPDPLDTWLLTASRQYRGSIMLATDADIARVRHDFGCLDAEEDNHEANGMVRKLFLVVDPRFRMECECKEDETVHRRRDGYVYSQPKDRL
jgi:hypothetical protein